jgi:hypothetical protein
MSPRPLRGVYNVEDLRRGARRRLPKAVFEIIDRGAGDEVTLRANREAFRRIWLRPRAMQDVSAVDLTTTVLGERISFCGAPTVAAVDASLVSVGSPGVAVRGDAAVAEV